ncbi:hypothetical protein EKN09_11845 [Vibrio penaeicida]|uniref:hypothetical protein n=1 Tax=Vibrio penaeicida TaxID=104609 RepID=UPI000F82B9F1|nr:hypothetical protein [Vibrio penaeicida]RTZ22882.1 hypothetical protein EKN09_11845 [Vibrio penaeicida]
MSKRDRLPIILIQLAINIVFNNDNNGSNLVSQDETPCFNLEKSHENPINLDELVLAPVQIANRSNSHEEKITKDLEKVFNTENKDTILSNSPEIKLVEERLSDKSVTNTSGYSQYNEIISNVLARENEKDFRDYLIDFRNERLETDWATLMENNIKDFIFLRSNHLELNLDGVSCASQSCQIKINSPNALRTYVHSLFIDMSQESWWEFKRISAQDTSGHNGITYAVYLLSPDTSYNDN